MKIEWASNVCKLLMWIQCEYDSAEKQYTPDGYRRTPPPSTIHGWLAKWRGTIIGNESLRNRVSLLLSKVFRVAHWITATGNGRNEESCLLQTCSQEIWTEESYERRDIEPWPPLIFSRQGFPKGQAACWLVKDSVQSFKGLQKLSPFHHSETWVEVLSS